MKRHVFGLNKKKHPCILPCMHYFLFMSCWSMFIVFWTEMVDNNSCNVLLAGVSAHLV